MNKINEDVIHMALIYYVYVSHGGHRNQLEGCVTLMWITTVCCVILTLERYCNVAFQFFKKIGPFLRLEIPFQ